MSNIKNEQIMSQVMSVVDRMAGNPNSKLDVTNLFETISKLTATVTAGYQAVDNLETSTSLTAAVSPAETVAEVKTAPVAAPATAEAVPAAAPVATVAETVQPAPADQPVKAAAKRTANNTVKSAPAAKAAKSQTKEAPVIPAPVLKAPEPTPEVAPVTEAKAPVAKAGRKAGKAKATKAAKVSKRAAKQQEAAPMTQEQKDLAIAESTIQEHGSARAAAAYVEKNRTRGRKTAWQKIIEERADQELRAAARSHKKINAEGLASAIASVKGTDISEAEAARDYSLRTTGYGFSHIDRTPKVDPEKALGSMITCLIDGEKRTMMSRYIEAKYAMKPEEYIAHFDLRPDYPMTADTYKKEKRRLAEVQELGKRKTDEVAPVEEQATPAATNRRSRSRAAA
ncbi:MucR family transcriptional regulator [Agrobacterium salinitolerans]|nr:MucR family transcriptional regulator [Agrobacterium salinitolerans]